MHRIVVVEDDPSVATVMATFLRARGYEVRVAGRLSEARQLLHEAAPALVIADEQLPDGMGSDLLRALATTMPSVGRMLLTASASPDLGALPAGTLVRHKPWDVAEAESTLVAILGRPGDRSR